MAAGFFAETVCVFDVPLFLCAVFLPGTVADLPAPAPVVAVEAFVVPVPAAGAAGETGAACCANAGSAARAKAPARSRLRDAVDKVLVMEGPFIGWRYLVSETAGQRRAAGRVSKADR